MIRRFWHAVLDFRFDPFFVGSDGRVAGEYRVVSWALAFGFAARNPSSWWRG